jgi:hypothetical protein
LTARGDAYRTEEIRRAANAEAKIRGFLPEVEPSVGRTRLMQRFASNGEVTRPL